MSDTTPGLNYAEFDKLRHTLTSTGVGTTTVNDKNVNMVAVHTPAHRLCGTSSDAMTRYAFGVGPRPCTPGTPIDGKPSQWENGEYGRDFPYDTDDLGACHETVRLARALTATGIPALRIAPEVIERMVDVYAEFWRWIAGGVNRHGVHIAHTQWHPLPDKAAR